MLPMLNYVIIQAFVLVTAAILKFNFIFANKSVNMPKGRGKKRKNDRSTDQADEQIRKSLRASTETPANTTEIRSTRSSAKSTDRATGSKRNSEDGTTERVIIQDPDPRKIILNKGRNNNATPGGVKDADKSNDAVSKTPEVNDQNSGAKQTVNSVTQPNVNNTCADLAPLDPGTELDYEDNLDVAISVSRPDDDDGENTDEEESTLLNMLKTNPKLKNFFRRLVHEEKEQDQQPTTEKSTVNQADKEMTPGKRARMSFSEATMYVPALVRKDINDTPGVRNTVAERHSPNRHNLRVNEISNFLEQTRIEQRRDRTQQSVDRHEAVAHTSKERQPNEIDIQEGVEREESEEERDAREIQKAKDIARARIVEAEKFRVTVDVTPGAYNPDNDDDAFYMSTCHTEDAVAEKAYSGKFVDMNKIYPKQNDFKSSQDTRLEIINKDGRTYFVPAGDNTKRVYNFHTWQKAFRVYATLYSKANPLRAAEILQYMDVIGNAASSFVWENVAAYDYVHRQLMDEKPKRTWGKIYQQGWSMCMKEHLPFKASGNIRKGKTPSKNDKDPYCWRFNKNNCRRVHCRYEHRCSYCGATGHGAYNCMKKDGNDKKDEGTTVEKKNAPSTK